MVFPSIPELTAFTYRVTENLKLHPTRSHEKGTIVIDLLVLEMQNFIAAAKA